MSLKNRFERGGAARFDHSDPKVAAPKVAAKIVSAIRNLSSVLEDIKYRVDLAGKDAVLAELGDDAREFESTYETLRAALQAVDEDAKIEGL